MSDYMELKIHAEGSAFVDNSNLRSVINLLDSYEITFSECLKKSVGSHKVIHGGLYPKLKLKAIERGSLDVRLVTDVTAAIAPLAPQIFGYAWQLYKSAYDLITIATRHFKTQGTPMTIRIENSPGATVNIINGDQVVVNQDTFDTACSMHKFFDKIAKLIKNREADKILVETDQPEYPEQIQFDRTNQDNFELPSSDITEDTPVEFECDIYRFNKKTLNGSLEFEDQDEVLIRPFKASRDHYHDCLNAFRAPRAKVKALREVETNALGETKVKKFHILSIKPIFGDS